MLNEFKKLRMDNEKEYQVELYSSRSVEEFLSIMMEQDFNRVLNTIVTVLQVLDIDETVADALRYELESVSSLIEQCYIANVVLDLEKRGYIYEDKHFVKGVIKIPYKEIVLKDLDEVISMYEQLNEIKGLDEYEH